MGPQGTSQVYNPDDKCCRICHDDGGREKLVSPCYCSGSMGSIHVSCLEKWLGLNGRTSCELCSYTFPVVKVYPTVWQYFKVLLKNWRRKVMLCLFMLLVAVNLLCIASGMCFEHVGKADTEIVVLMLMFSLLDAFDQYRYFLIWQQENAQTKRSFDKTPPPIIRKCPNTIREQAHRAETSRLGQTQGAIPLLKPGSSSDPTTSLAANGNGVSEDGLLNENAWTNKNTKAKETNNITSSMGTRSLNIQRDRSRHRSCCTCKVESSPIKGIVQLGHDERTSAFRVYNSNPNAKYTQLPVVQRGAAQDDTDEFFPKLVNLCKENNVTSQNTNNIISSVCRKGSKTEKRMSRKRSRATDKTVGSSTDGQLLVTRGLALLGNDHGTSAFKVCKPK